jgi:putative FmdB family regulatory protein
MPTYEYACEKCGHEFEREQRITEDPVKTCPKCRARKVQRLISNTSFVLKGSGWYSDLYSSKKPDKKPDSSSESSGGEEKTEKSSETGKEKAEKPGKKTTGKKTSKKAAG